MNRPITLLAFVLCLVGTLIQAQPPAGDAHYQWGAPVDGLQIGIAPALDKNGAVLPVVDGRTVRVRTAVRNRGSHAVRLLTPTYLCLLGDGDPLMVSGLVFTPKNGGPTLTATYGGWNHASLLDKRRRQGEQPQQTLDKSHGQTEVQMSAEDAARLAKVIEPGQQWRAHIVTVGVGEGKPVSFWNFGPGKSLAPGLYSVTAVLTVTSAQSAWRGEIVSTPIEVEIQ